ncbi:hypothetical protein OZX74_00100 [Bifidobacterium sp. ESL0798]|uniref:hypothetical protein n=1 Tax=Bifidobacterium sp. ESL0798 TaxID=2983235 RepID=UPI0023F85B86|nr:hypothetical protein [Bifidobacterium sp. ESL0798]WEV74024.1 hypothetical protein OZX74_00100 [Bifidobacterium sp. ESL0798]
MFLEGSTGAQVTLRGGGNGGPNASGSHGRNTKGANVRKGSGVLSETGSSVTQVVAVAVATLLLDMALSAVIKGYGRPKDDA